MFKNYLKVTFYALVKSRLYSAINILGLTVGLAATILIGLFVADELSYDKHYADVDDIYRVSRDYQLQDIHLAANAPQAATLLKKDFPQIEYAARIFGGQALLRKDDIAFYENNIRFADNEFFQIFNFDWVKGDPRQALLRPFTVVLTESIARKYFGDSDVVGKSLILENSAPLEVTGVIRDLPHSTHLDLSVIISMNSLAPIAGEEFLTDWGSNNFHTYIKLKQGERIEPIVVEFPNFLNRYVGEKASTFTGMTAMSLTDIHLHSKRQFEMSTPGSITNIYVFSSAAVCILLIACMNFMNLSTAGSSRRSKEVGVRKSLGATRRQVAWQFVGESLLITVIAGVLALVLVELVLPYFNFFLGKELVLELSVNSQFFLGLVILIPLVGVLAGSYPAFYLSAFKPMHVLKKVLSEKGSVFFRNSLVVMQFSIAIVLVVATLVVLMQMRFANNIELGFQKEQIIVLNGSPTAGLGPQWDSIRRELLSHPEILAVTASGQTPLEDNTNAAAVIFEGQETGRAMSYIRVDYDFFNTYNVPIIAGREFSENFPSDRIILGLSEQSNPSVYGVILNRLAVEQLGWAPEQAIGKWVKGLRGPQESIGGRVVGVVENSYFESVRKPIKPLLFYMPQRNDKGVALLPEASIRLSGNHIQETLTHIDNTWRKFMPEFPLQRNFLNEDFDAMYRAEDRQGKLFYAFSFLSIFLACMGLYGLATFNAECRRKEVGVRKVMGGTVWSIVLLLTNDFSRLVLIANVIAWPVAYFAMNRWLENFAYRIDLTSLIFVGSGLITLCIAWVTVGGIAAKAASQKPVLALRYE